MPSRRALAIAAPAVVAALVGGILVVRHATRDDHTNTLRALRNLPPADAPASTSPTPSPRSAAPAPSPSASAPGGAPRQTGSVPPDVAASLRGETGDGLGPHPPGSVTFPYRAGQTTWDATSNGVQLHLSISAGARVGVPMTWTMTARDGDGDCCGVYVVYGDGYTAPSQLDCLKLGSGTMQRQHTFNKPGRHYFLVQGTSDHCNRNGEIFGSFDVGPGTSTAQGPTLPTVQLDSSTPVPGHERDPYYVTLWGHAEDEDGYMTKLVVTYGDGTSKTFGGDPNPCQTGRDGWPVSSYADLPYDPPTPHHYTKPGQYTITLTAYSAGCDGSMVQTAKATYVWPVPEPAPPGTTSTPTPSPTPTPTPSASPTPSATPS